MIEARLLTEVVAAWNSFMDNSIDHRCGSPFVYMINSKYAVNKAKSARTMRKAEKVSARSSKTWIGLWRCAAS
jgi:hypothetical protein